MLTSLVLVGFLFFNTQFTTESVSYNNPGNLVKTSVQWKGETERQGRFTAFETAHYGLRALCITLYRYEQRHRIDTVFSLVKRYAPPHENNTKRYAKYVAYRLGVKTKEKISLSSHMPTLVKAIIQYEQGHMPYTDMEIRVAMLDALFYVTKNK